MEKDTKEQNCHHDECSPRRKVLFNYSSSSTLHGFCQTCQETGSRKGLWRFLFVCAIGMSIAMFYQVTIDFFKYKTYLTIDNFPYYERDLILPTLTVCTKVALITRGYERVRNIINITEKEYENFHIKYLSRYLQKTNIEIPKEEEIFKALRENNYTTPESVFKLFEINKDDIFNDSIAKLFLMTMEGDSPIPTCRYNYRYKCDTKETMSWRESLCHQINYFEKDKLPIKGWLSEKRKFRNIVTVLNIYVTDLFRRSREIRQSAPFMDLITGVVLYVHPYGTPHYVKEATERIFLLPGVWNFIRIRHNEVIDLPSPYRGNCGERPFKWLKHDAIGYSRAYCILDCFVEIKYRECGCVGWELKEFVDLPVCELTQNRCWVRRRESIIQGCKNADCPRDCKMERYDIRTEQLQLRSEIVREKIKRRGDWTLNDSATEEYIKNNIVGIQVEYTDDAKVEKYVPAVTWNTLLGTIGGSLGLAMGMSILTVFELLFFAYDYFTAPRTPKTIYPDIIQVAPANEECIVKN